MRRGTVLALHVILLLSMLIGTVRAADMSALSQFVGSPLLVLVVILVIDLIAFAYHRIGKR